VTNNNVEWFAAIVKWKYKKDWIVMEQGFSTWDIGVLTILFIFYDYEVLVCIINFKTAETYTKNLNLNGAKGRDSQNFLSKILNIS
jgi:hypothetical protein